MLTVRYVLYERERYLISLLIIVFFSLVQSYFSRAFESEKGREVLEREDCIDNEADRLRHAKLMNRLNKLDLALLQAHSTAMLMGQQ